MDWLRRATESPYPDDYEDDLLRAHGPIPCLEMALTDPRAEAEPRAYVLSEYVAINDERKYTSKRVCRRALDFLEKDRLSRSEDEYQDFIKELSGYSLTELEIAIGMTKRGRVKGTRREVHRLVQETFVIISDLPDLDMKEFSNDEMMRNYPGLSEDDERQRERAHGRDEHGEYDFFERKDDADGSIHYEKTYRPPTKDEYVVFEDTLCIGFWNGNAKWTFRCRRKKHKAQPNIIPPCAPELPDL